MSLKNFLDITGLDLIPYAIGKSKFTSSVSFEPATLQGIKAKVKDLDNKKIEEALKFSKELLDEENARGEKAESKAYNLIGVTGVSAAFITGISNLFPRESFTTAPLLHWFLLICYLLVVVSLTLTILLASKAVTVRSYTRPHMADIFSMESHSLQKAKIERLTSYMYCYNENSKAHNVKISYLMGAQLWFRNSITIFLVLAVLLISNYAYNENSTSQILASPTPSLIVMSPTVYPTNTIAYTETVTRLPTIKPTTISIQTTKTPLSGP